MGYLGYPRAYCQPRRRVLLKRIVAVVLDYFGGERTERCLRSLSGQGLTEVRLVDNSGDGAYQAEFSRRLHALRNELDYQLRCEANQENVGFAKGVNQALRNSEEEPWFEYLLLINNDAELTPGIVAALFTALKDHPTFGMVGPATRTCGSTVRALWYQRHTGLITSYWTPGSFRYISGACVLIDSRAINDDLFDEAFFMYGEDVDLNWRLLKRGYVPTCVADAEIDHLGSGSSRKGELFYEFHVLRGHMLLARRLASWGWELPLMYLGRIVVLGMRAFFRSARYGKLAPLQAMLRVMAGKSRLGTRV